MATDLIPVKVWFRSGEEWSTIHLEGNASERLNSIKVGQRTYFFDHEGNYDGFGEPAIDQETVKGR
jgi:hypothetical protein